MTIYQLLFLILWIANHVFALESDASVANYEWIDDDWFWVNIFEFRLGYLGQLYRTRPNWWLQVLSNNIL